jgi:hypothetical protein
MPAAMAMPLECHPVANSLAHGILSADAKNDVTRALSQAGERANQTLI